jgi:hypothetical protein
MLHKIVAPEFTKLALDTPDRPAPALIRALALKELQRAHALEVGSPHGGETPVMRSAAAS